MSLLHCKTCGNSVNVRGAQGPYIHTVCTHCGLDNSSMISVALDQKPVEIVRVPIKKRKPSPYVYLY